MTQTAELRPTFYALSGSKLSDGTYLNNRRGFDLNPSVKNHSFKQTALPQTIILNNRPFNYTE